MSNRNNTDLVWLITAWFFITVVGPSPASGDPSSPVDGGNLLHIASTILAPVYGPLAEQIVSEFDLAEMEGIGIDVGGGYGNLAIELAKRSRQMHWINADINPKVISYVRQAVKEAGVEHLVSAQLVDVHEMPFSEGYADIIVSRGSFQFWIDGYIAFSEIYRVLKPGGAAFIGRGFSENLPIDVAREIRAQQREKGSLPVYNVEEAAVEFKEIMESVGIKEYRIRIPKPSGSEGINYGLWLKFHKPGSK